MDKITDTAVNRAGGVSALADHLGLTRQAVFKWTRIPAHHVMKVSALVGIPPEKLRPDIFKEATR